MSTVVTVSEVLYVLIDIKAVWICGISAGGLTSCTLYRSNFGMLASVTRMYNWYFSTDRLCLFHTSTPRSLDLLKVSLRASVDLLLWFICTTISWRGKAMKLKIHLGRWGYTLQLFKISLKIISDQHFGCLAHMIQKKWRLKSLLHSESIWNILGYWFSFLLCGPEDSLNDNGHVRQQLLHLAVERDKCEGSIFKT